MTTKTIGPTVLISERRMGHNQSDIHEHDAIDSLTSGWALGEFNPQDYPVLVWLISNIGCRDPLLARTSVVSTLCPITRCRIVGVLRLSSNSAGKIGRASCRERVLVAV